MERLTAHYFKPFGRFACGASISEQKKAGGGF